MTSRIGIAIVLVGAALLVTSSVGVSTVALERSIEIEVVDDETASVGFDTPEASASAENRSEIDLVTVTNRAGTSLDVTVDDVTGGEFPADALKSPETIDAGESAPITAAISCENVAAESISIDLTVTGDGITIERTIEATPCRG